MTPSLDRLATRFAESAPQFLRFCIVGAVGFCVDAAVLLAVTRAGILDPISGRLVSFSCAVMATFELNWRWAFRPTAPRSYRRSLVTYLGVQGVGFLCNFAAYALLLLTLPAPWGKPLFCLAVASGLALMVNYAGARKIVFRQRPT